VRRLVLVKHAMPVVVDGVTPARWVLADAGRRDAAALAEQLARAGIARVVASEEPKARETGRILAERLGVPCETRTGLHEHDRSNVTRLDTREQFEARVRELFARPGELVYGVETADAALARFRAAVMDVVSENVEASVAVVSHGTVIALFVAAVTGGEGFEIWKKLGLPSCVVLALPEWKVVE
jgi:broad specificity phosphatase PhoE